MNGTKTLLDQIEIDLKHNIEDTVLTVYIDVFDNSLSKKWVVALNNLLEKNYHLEKNYCFFGFANGPRNGKLICDQINLSIAAINQANIGYQIEDYFTIENTIQSGPVGVYLPGRKLIKEKFNQLHLYFEELQGVSGRMSEYYNRANDVVRWHIRQLNLLCHEYESWVLSYRKIIEAPEWQRPSQLMCWLHAPRFVLSEEDYELFGVDTICRPMGGVFVGVNKAVGKHHWEVFVDEAELDPNFIADNLTTTVLKGQTEAAGDFDIEWANDTSEYDFQKKHLADFKLWLVNNGFDPEDKSLTIGHPQVGQVDLLRTFGTKDYNSIWDKLSKHLNVVEIRSSLANSRFEYNWSDPDFIDRQITIIKQGH
jgi:hypothetical protein